MDSALITFLSNAGTAGVVLILVILGLLVPKPYYTRMEEENRLLREALALERQRATDTAGAAAVTNQLITALTDMAAERHHAGEPPASLPTRGADLTWEDLK